MLGEQIMDEELHVFPPVTAKPFRTFVGNMYYDCLDEHWAYNGRHPGYTQEEYYLSNKKWLKEEYRLTRRK
jgi:hypothetical protein